MKLAINNIVISVLASLMMFLAVACQSTQNSNVVNANIASTADEKALSDKASELQTKLKKAQAARDDLSVAEISLELRDVLNRIQSANRDRALLMQVLYPQNQKRTTEAGDVLGQQYPDASQVQMGRRSQSLGDSFDLKPVSNTATGGIR